MTTSWDLPSGKWIIEERGPRLLGDSIDAFEDTPYGFTVGRLSAKVDSNCVLHPPEFEFSPLSGERLVYAIESNEDEWAANLTRFPGGKVGDLRTDRQLLPDWDNKPEQKEIKLLIPSRGHFELFSMKAGAGRAINLPVTLFALYPKDGTLFMYAHDADFAAGKWVELELDESSPLLVKTDLPSSAWRILVVEVAGVQTALIPTEQGLVAVRPDPISKTFSTHYVSDFPVIGGPVLWQNQSNRNKVVIVSAGSADSSSSEVLIFDFLTDSDFQVLHCSERLSLEVLASQPYWSWPFSSGRSLYLTAPEGVIELGLSRDKKVLMRENIFLPHQKACLWGHGVMHTLTGDDHLLMKVEDSERGKLFARYDYSTRQIINEAPFSPFVACGEYSFRYARSLVDVSDSVHADNKHFIPCVSNNNQKWCAGIQIESDSQISLSSLLGDESTDFSVCAAVYSNAKNQTVEIGKLFKAKAPWNTRMFFYGDHILIYNTSESFVAPTIRAMPLLQKVGVSS